MSGDNPPAFACANADWYQQGMTLRDWFAGHALAALRIDQAFIDQGVGMDRLPEEHAATISFGIADAMLAARGAA